MNNVSTLARAPVEQMRDAPTKAMPVSIVEQAQQSKCPPAGAAAAAFAMRQRYPKARTAGLASFMALANSGHPYENHMAVEDLAGRRTPPQFLEPIRFRQRDPLEWSVECAKEALDVGVRWR